MKFVREYNRLCVFIYIKGVERIKRRDDLKLPANAIVVVLIIKITPGRGNGTNHLRNENFKIVMRCAVWHRLCNLKNVKSTHEGVLLLVKLQALPFSRFLNSTKSTKS